MILVNVNCVVWALDLCIAIHDIEITSHHREIVLATLNEEIDIQMMKDFITAQCIIIK